MPALFSLAFILLALLNLFSSLVSAAPVGGETRDVEQTQKNPKCADVIQRREWRSLSNDQKDDYIKAVKCMQSLPAIKPVIKEAKSRYDEFQAYHIKEADAVHLTGEFLPWHRQYVKVFEDELRQKCGYKGAVPYWNWSIDADSPKPLSAAPVFDATHGFGGDGAPGTYALPSENPPADYLIYPTSFKGCVIDGPFAHHNVPLGPGKYIGDHCLTRGIQEGAKAYLNSTAVQVIAALQTYADFHVEIEGMPVTSSHRPHDGGHFMIGGDMSNLYSSPGDPLFYLHHANLDRIWWQWQNVEPSRLYEMTGRSTATAPFTDVTLDFPLTMGTLGESVTIGDVMNIHREPNCYTYA